MLGFSFPPQAAVKHTTPLIHRSEREGGLKISWPRRIYIITLTLVWLVLVTGLWQRFYAQHSGTVLLSLESGLQQLPDEMEWMNILMNGEKVGYAWSSITNLEEGGYQVDDNLVMNTLLAGMPVQVTTSSRVVVDTDFRFKSFDIDIKSGLYDTRITGVVEDGRIKARRIEGGNTIPMEFSINRDIYPDLVIKHLLVQRGIRPGDSFSLPVFDPMSQESLDLVISHEGSEEITVASEKRRLNKIKIMYGEMPTYIWLDENGITWREEGLLGMALERTDVACAMDLPAGLGRFDIAAAYAVPVEGMIINDRTTSELVIGISGLGADIPPALQNNFIRKGKGDEQIFRLSSKPEAAPGIDRQSYLQSTALIQADHPRIVAQAKEITAAATDPEQQVNRLVDWVYRNLQKVAVANLSSAYEILDKKVGDCSEHTTLFAALSRSLGLPTRVNMGVVYLDGQFYYHAWPSVLIDGQWLSIDPTFGQHRADATHLALVQGDFTNMTDLLPIIGQIKIRIIEYH